MTKINSREKEVEYIQKYSWLGILVEVSVLGFFLFFWLFLITSDVYSRYIYEYKYVNTYLVRKPKKEFTDISHLLFSDVKLLLVIQGPFPPGN